MREGNKLYVLDACVVLKWILPEREDVENALALKNDFSEGRIDLMVPEHLIIEACNTVVKKLPHFLVSFFNRLNNIFTPHRLNEEVVLLTGQLIARYPKISFYDASYHSLALCKRAIFVTSDEKYYQLVKKEGGILLLKNYPLDGANN